MNETAKLSDLGPFDSLDERELNRAYVGIRLGLRAAVDAAKRSLAACASRTCATEEEYLARALHHRLAAQASSVLTLSPVPGAKAGWDVASIASLTGDMADAYLVLLYLVVDDVPANEREARKIVMRAHDRSIRGHGLSDDPARQLEKIGRVIRREAAENAYLSGLPARRRRELLCGERPPHADGGMIERLIVDHDYFAKSYDFLRSKARCFPPTLHRAAQDSSLSDSEGRAAKTYILFALHFAARILTDASERTMSIISEAACLDAA